MGRWKVNTGSSVSSISPQAALQRVSLEYTLDLSQKAEKRVLRI